MVLWMECCKMSERPKQAKTDRQRKTLAIISIAIFLGVTALVCWKIGPRMLQLASDPESFRQWLSQRRASGFLIYGAMVIFQVIFAVIPGEPLEIAGGYAFGTLWGTVVCLLSATIGSLLVFGLVRRFGTPLVELFFPKESFRSIRFLQSSPQRTFLFFLIYMIPGTPKDLLSYFAGLTDIRFPVFLLMCSVGRLPSVITSMIGGDALGSKSYVFAIVVFLVTLAISGIGVLCYHWICRRHGTHRESNKKK